MGRTLGLLKYAELLDPQTDMPVWAMKYARWLIASGVWGERLEGMGRRRRSKAEHLAVVASWTDPVPWKVLVALRQTRKFQEYGKDWLKNPGLRRKEKLEEVTEMAIDRAQERLEEAGERDENGKLKMLARDAMKVITPVLNVGIPRKSDGDHQAPLIQINITEHQERSILKALEGPKEEIPEVTWEIVKE